MREEETIFQGIDLGPSVIGNQSSTESDRSIDTDGVDLKKSIIGW